MCLCPLLAERVAGERVYTPALLSSTQNPQLQYNRSFVLEAVGGWQAPAPAQRR